MRNRHWFWGIFFLLAAVFVIVSQLTPFDQIGGPIVLATVLLLLLIIRSLIRLHFLGILLPTAFLYMIYQQPLHLAYISPWMLILSAVLARIGLGYLFHDRFYGWRTYSRFRSDSWSTVSQSSDDDNNPFVKTAFDSSCKYVHADSLKTGRFITSFGKLEVFLGEAQLDPAGAEIYLDCSFGEIQLYVPKYWRVNDRVQASFGAVENSPRLSQPAENAPVLTLTGSVQFGSIRILYI